MKKVRTEKIKLIGERLNY